MVSSAEAANEEDMERLWMATMGELEVGERGSSDEIVVFESRIFLIHQ